jgi:hypothetical protein
MSVCPEGTELRQFYGGLIIAVIIDVIMIALFFYLRFRYEPAQVRPLHRQANSAKQGGVRAWPCANLILTDCPAPPARSPNFLLCHRTACVWQSERRECTVARSSSLT